MGHGASAGAGHWWGAGNRLRDFSGAGGCVMLAAWEAKIKAEKKRRRLRSRNRNRYPWEDARFSRLRQPSRRRLEARRHGSASLAFMGAMGGCRLLSCFPTLFARNAKRMGHGGFLRGRVRIKTIADPSTRPGAAGLAQDDRRYLIAQDDEFFSEL
jgi:hypothetical protein